MGVTDDSDSSSTRFEQLTTSELSLAIHETVMSNEDKRIAELRYLKLETLERIAEIMMLDKKTVRKRLLKILPRISWTVDKLLR